MNSNIANNEDAKIAAFIDLAKDLLWTEPGVRQRLQQAGFNLTPSNFYSAIPSIDEIATSFEANDQTVPIYLKPFDDVVLRSFLSQIAPYASEFSPSIDGDEQLPEVFFWKNSQFSGCDAMAYYAVIRHVKPRRIVEVGSGFSTLIALEATRRNGFGEITCIEPYPRQFLKEFSSINLIEKRIQEISLNAFADMMADVDILFIDSTHTVKIGSDCLYIYLLLLPTIKQKLLLHAHDIFLPFGMPREWALKHHIYWTEQYLLYAFLLENQRTVIKYSSAYQTFFQRPEMERFMNSKWKTGGGSIWIEIN